MNELRGDVESFMAGFQEPFAPAGVTLGPLAREKFDFAAADVNRFVFFGCDTAGSGLRPF